MYGVDLDELLGTVDEMARCADALDALLDDVSQRVAGLHGTWTGRAAVAQAAAQAEWEAGFRSMRDGAGDDADRRRHRPRQLRRRRRDEPADVGAGPMRVEVLGSGYAGAVEALVSGNLLAADTCAALADRLQGYAGMAGDDSTAAEFAASYDEAAAEALAALADLVGAFGSLGHLAQASLANHHAAEVASGGFLVAAPPTRADDSVGDARSRRRRPPWAATRHRCPARSPGCSTRSRASSGRTPTPTGCAPRPTPGAPRPPRSRS